MRSFETPFRPRIPVVVRGSTGEQLAVGKAEARQEMGPNGFSTRYLTDLEMADGHTLDELLEDTSFELVLGTGHALTGHFYSTAAGAASHTVALFIPQGT